MKVKSKRVSNLKYVISDFPPKPRKVIKYALIRDGSDLYFVNQSVEVIEQVSAESYGCLTEEDTVYSAKDTPSYTYNDILSGEAVLIESYSDDRIFSDFTLGLYIYITTTDGELRVSPTGRRCGIKSQILVYGDGSTPRYVSITKGGV